MSKATVFYDMHSGGYKKTDYDVIVVELPEELALKFFYLKYDRTPDNVTCECCGADFGYTEYDTLEEALESYYYTTWGGNKYVFTNKQTKLIGE
jgi:hypothetical protein